MKPKTRLNQRICRIKITMYKQEQFHDAKLFPDEVYHDYSVDSLKVYIPLWEEFFDKPIKAEQSLWEELMELCYFGLLPSQDSWIQYTANEILAALDGCKHRFKKDCNKNHPIVDSLITTNQPHSAKEMWKIYCEDYYIVLHLDDFSYVNVKGGGVIIC